MRWLKARYRPALRFSLARPRAVIGTALVLLAVAAVVATRLGSEFVPRLREGSIAINTVRLAGVSLDESVRYGTEIERAFPAFPDEIERIWTRTGTAEVATDPMGVELSDIFITLGRDWWKGPLAGRAGREMEASSRHARACAWSSRSRSRCA